MKKLLFVFFVLAYPILLFGQSQDTICICGKLIPKIDTPIMVEDIPRYPGGKEALKKLIATNIELDSKENGKINISFIISCKGSTCGIKVLSKDGISTNTENQVIKNLKSMDVWRPAKQRNNAIDIAYKISITITNGFIELNSKL